MGLSFNDWLYVVSSLLLIPVFILALWAQFRVSSTFKRASKLQSTSGMSGREIAEKLLLAANCNVRVELGAGGALSDHYDPKRKVIVLSHDVYNGTNVAALGVAAHEVGHAIQDETGYAPLRIRNAVIPFSNIISRAIVPLIIIGIIVDLFAGLSVNFAIYMVLGAVVVYALSTIINLITLPTEFNASHRAVQLLEASGAISTEQEKRQVKKVLNSAALTYVAALAVSLLQLIRLLSLLSRMRKR